MENYYLILGLSIERFVSDIAALDAALEKKRNEWNSSNNPNIKANVHKYIVQGHIKEAYSNPAEWRRIYEEAKALVDKEIKLSLQAISGKGYVTSKEVEKSFKKYKANVSVDYADRIRVSLNIEKRDDSSPRKEDQRKKASLKNYEPEAANTFKTPAEKLKIINCTDYYSFLITYTKKIGSAYAGTAFSANTDPGRCAAAADEIECAWKGKKEDEEKSAIDRICGQIKGFPESGAKSQENYNRFLLWQRIKDVLDKLWSVFSIADENNRVMKDEVKSEFIKQLVEIVSDRGVAEDLLEERCIEKKIQMPKKVANVAVCPFCNNAFEKKGAAPSVCPCCGRSLMFTCPKCGKKVNYLETRSCCGFNFDLYPRVEKMCAEASRYTDLLDFDLAEDTLREAEKLWPGFEGTAPVRSEIERKKRNVGEMVKALNKSIQERKFFAAKNEYERIKRANAGYSDSVKEKQINDSIAEAERLFREYRAERNGQEQLRKLTRVSQLCADYPGLDSCWGSIELFPAKDLKVSVSQNSGDVNITWSSDNPAGTAEFVIQRKEFSRPASTSDGVTVARTTETGHSDKITESGIPYYYAVYAVRGSTRSQLTHYQQPLLLFPVIRKADVIGEETMIRAAWEDPGTIMTPEVFRTNDPSVNTYGQGIKLTNVSSTGFVDTGLAVNRSYFYNVFFTLQAEPIMLMSPCFQLAGKTVKKSAPLSIEVNRLETEGEYEIHIIDGLDPESTVQFYSSKTGSLAKGTPLQLGSLIGMPGISRVSVIEKRKDIFSLSVPKGGSYYLYAVNVKQDTAVIGDSVFVDNYPSIPVRTKYNGVNLYIELEEWPKDTEMIYVAYSTSDYPRSITDESAFRLSVNRLNYKAENIVIKNIEHRNYYITGFIKKAGEEKQIFKTLFANQEKTIIKYSFRKSLLGKLTVHFSLSENAALPEMSLRYRTGTVVGSSEASGIELCVVPAVLDNRNEYSYDVQGYKVNKDHYGKLFIRNEDDKERYKLLLDGPPSFSGK